MQQSFNSAITDDTSLTDLSANATMKTLQGFDWEYQTQVCRFKHGQWFCPQ